MSFSIFNSFNGNSCKLGQNYSIVSRDIDPPTTVTYITGDSSSVTFSFTAPTTSGTILSYTPYINGSVASGSGTPSSYTINGLTAGTQYTVNMVANIAASITTSTGTVPKNVISNPSVPVALYTLDTFPTNLQFISATSNSVTLKFNPPIGTVSGYTPYVNGSVATGSGSTTSYTISGLTNGTTYSIAIAANFYLDTSSSLFQYYRFEQSDVSGTKLLNYATKSYDASFVNGSTIISTTGNYKVGSSALNLISDHNYATSPYVTIPSINVSTNGLSFSLWFRSNCNAPIGTASHIFDFGNGSTSDNVLMFIYPPNVSTGNLGFEVYPNSTDSYGSFGFSYSPISAVNDNVWRHVVWTLTYSTTKNSTWNIYLNGSFSSTTTGYYPRNISRSGNYIGKSLWSTDEMFNGQVDDFRVYNTVLSASDAAQLYAYNPKNSIFYLDTSSSLVQYYKFEQNDISGSTLANWATGSPVFDASLVNNPTIDTSNYKIGYGSMYFNGTNYVKLPTLQASNNYTFCVWFNCGNPTSDPSIFNFNTSDRNNSIFLTFDNASNLQLGVWSGTTRILTWPIIISNVSTSLWYHVAIVFSGSSVISYVNGTYGATYTMTAALPYVSRVTNYLAKDDSGNPDYMKNLDDFRVYNTALSASDIAQIYGYNPNFFKSSSVLMTTTN